MAVLCVKNGSKEKKSSLGSLLKIVMNFRENAQGAKYCEDAKKRSRRGGVVAQKVPAKSQFFLLSLFR